MQRLQSTLTHQRFFTNYQSLHYQSSCNDFVINHIHFVPRFQAISIHVLDVTAVTSVLLSCQPQINLNAYWI